MVRQFAISDRTFEMDAIPSWGAHLELVAQTLNNFVGVNRVPRIRGDAGQGLGL